MGAGSKTQKLKKQARRFSPPAMFSVKREREDVEEPQSAKRKVRINLFAERDFFLLTRSG